LELNPIIDQIDPETTDQSVIRSIGAIILTVWKSHKTILDGQQLHEVLHSYADDANKDREDTIEAFLKKLRKNAGL